MITVRTSEKHCLRHPYRGPDPTQGPGLDFTQGPGLPLTQDPGLHHTQDPDLHPTQGPGLHLTQGPGLHPTITHTRPDPDHMVHFNHLTDNLKISRQKISKQMISRQKILPLISIFQCSLTIRKSTMAFLNMTM